MENIRWLSYAIHINVRTKIFDPFLNDELFPSTTIILNHSDIETHTHIHTYIHTCFLLISMLWHRQAIFKSKGDKLCSSAECRIWTRGLRHQFASRLNACWQTDWAIEDQAKNLNSTARPYDQRAFSPLGPTVSWLSHLALAIYMFVVVNFDALAQASDIQIERRQVVFLHTYIHTYIHTYMHTYLLV